MEESKLLALHESLSKLRKAAGLGVSSQYSWQRTAGASNTSSGEASVFTKTADGETVRCDGLPVNVLYNNFVKEGSYDPSTKSGGGHDGDGRRIKRNFSDCNSDDDGAAHVVSAPSSSDSDSSSSEDEESSRARRRREKKELKEKRKAEKKAAKKAAKLEAKRLAKLEEKKRLKKEAKLALKRKLAEEEVVKADSSVKMEVDHEPPRKKSKKSRDKNESEKETAKTKNKEKSEDQRKEKKKAKKEKR